MDFDSEEFYNLNRSLKSQVSYLVKDYSKLKTVIKSSEASSKRLSDNLGPLKSRISGLNSIASSMLKNGSSALGSSLVGSKEFDPGKIMNNMFSKFLGGMRANGGNVSAGSSYVVGERGPEIFTPTDGGHITPNNAISSRGNVNITMNISTPDMASFQRSEKQVISRINKAMRSGAGY